MKPTSRRHPDGAVLVPHHRANRLEPLPDDREAPAVGLPHAGALAQPDPPGTGLEQGEGASSSISNLGTQDLELPVGETPDRAADPSDPESPSRGLQQAAGLAELREVRARDYDPRRPPIPMVDPGVLRRGRGGQPEASVPSGGHRIDPSPRIERQLLEPVAAWIVEHEAGGGGLDRQPAVAEEGQPLRDAELGLAPRWEGPPHPTSVATDDEAGRVHRVESRLIPDEAREMTVVHRELGGLAPRGRRSPGQAQAGREPEAAIRIEEHLVDAPGEHLAQGYVPLYAIGDVSERGTIEESAKEPVASVRVRPAREERRFPLASRDDLEARPRQPHHRVPRTGVLRAPRRRRHAPQIARPPFLR